MDIVQIAFVIIIAFIVSALCTAIEIPVLRRHQLGQNIREEGPKSHMAKAGTPSMGGIAIVIAIILAALFMGGVSTDMIVMVAVTVLFGLIGFVDDSLKVVKKVNEGLKAWQKFGLQFVIAVAFAAYIAFCTDLGTGVYIPIADIVVDFNGWYIPFVVFVILAVVNSVNLTDGLDGLASGITVLVSLFFAIAASSEFFGVVDANIFFGAVAGACLGFLLFNKNPAKVFMGDTGSLALGGALAAGSILMQAEIFLIIAGFIYVAETASVIIQVCYFKATHGKRIFRMTPLHHHFEEGGMKETNVVLLFWTLSLACCLIAFFMLP